MLPQAPAAKAAAAAPAPCRYTATACAVTITTDAHTQISRRADAGEQGVREPANEQRGSARIVLL
jgi:hypothetical protein